MCGIPYEKQAKVIAVIEIATSLFGFSFVSIATLILGLSPDVRKEILHESEDNIFNIILHFSMPEKISSVAIPIIYFVCEFFLAAFYYRSISQRNYNHLRIWYIVTITICMTALYFFLPGVFFTEDSYYFIVVFIGSYAFTCYSVWVTHSFMTELKSEGLHAPVVAWEEDIDKL
ncbi:unnamed protein product [Orchesella dallaii]|uniref:Uncharacterized protein n=1 Tax=Orchesella dallaii TaxID=48710 RepID=A0ABP1QBQ8_9HEXA